MTLAYHETPAALRVRIRAHEKFSSLKMENVLESYLAGKSLLRILDMGCGSGNYSALMAKHASLYIGIDKNPDLLQLAQEACRRDHLRSTLFMQGDMDALPPFVPGSFDVVFYIYSAYYTNNIQRLLRRTRALLAGKGQAYFVGPTRGNAVELDKISQALFKASSTKQKDIRMNRLEDKFLPMIRREFSNHEATFKDFSVHFPNVAEYRSYYLATPQYAELAARYGARDKRDIEKAILQSTDLKLTKKGLMIRAGIS